MWKLLGGHRDRVPTYASGSLRRGLTDKQAEQAARILIQKGFREMKTQMGLPGTPTPADEVRRVRVVRDAIGPDIKLMCDINQRWRPEQAIDIGSRVEDVGLFWLEDVTTADDYQGLARVTAALKTPIAGGEYLWGIAPFRQMIQAHSVDIVMIDLVRVGGVSQFMKVAGMAEAFNLPVVSHVMPEMLVHVIAACPNGLTVEYMPWMLMLYEETPKIENGELVLPTKPGPRPQVRREGDRQVQGVSLAAHRQFQSAAKRQCHRPEPVGGVVDEGEVVGVVATVLLGIVANHDGARPQVRGDQLERRPRHRDPDVDQYEVHWPVDLFQRLT